MLSYDQTHLGSGWCQRNGRTIVERSRHATFWMGAHMVRGTRKRLFDHRKLQEMVITATGNHAETGGQHIEERSRVAIETV